jgi:autotransporter adhesin
VQSGGTAISNVATATKADQAVNKGQMDVAIAGVQDGVNGAVKYDRNTDGSINYDSAKLQGKDATIGKDGKYGIDTVQSGGTAISNVATATKADQAVNKGQMDVAIAGVQDGVNGAVKYDRNTDGSINYDSAKLQGKDATIGKDGKYGVDVVQSGGTTINNVATATKSDQAVNKGQVDLELAKLRDYSDQGNTKTLNTANSYTDRKVEELQSVFTQNMGKLEDKLSAGVAGAMAMASLAQPTTGRGTWGVALAGFNGQGRLHGE